MNPHVYGYMRALDGLSKRHEDEQAIIDFCHERNLVLIAMFYETNPGAPRQALKEMSSILMDKQRQRHVIVPSMRHLDGDEDQADNVRRGFEVITGIKAIDASRSSSHQIAIQ